MTSTADPPGPTLTRNSLPAAVSPVAGVKRYRMPVPAYFVSALGIVLALTAGVWVRESDAMPHWFAYASWGISAMNVGVLVAYQFKYMDIGPDGIHVRRIVKFESVGWTELVEVEWLRKKDYYLMVLSTQDGRRVATVWTAVAIPIGKQARARALRIQSDIEQAWATASGR